MSESQQPEGSPSAVNEIPLKERLRRPFARSAAVFVIGLVIDKLIKLVSPESIDRLSEFNAQLAAGAKSMQPWYGAALFWQKLTTNWPDDLTPLATPFFLLGRAFGGGVETILLPLSEGPETALPALVGYGLGFYMLRTVYYYRGKEMNLLVGIVGTILLGGLCLFVLQPVMIVATGFFGLILGAVSTNAIVLATVVPLAPIGSELIKHIIEERAEAVLDKALDAPKLQTERRLPEPAAQEKGDHGLTALPRTEGHPRKAEDDDDNNKDINGREPSGQVASDKDGPKDAEGVENRVFALKPVTQKLKVFLSAMGLVFVFTGSAIIFYDNMIIGIPLMLLGLVFLTYLSPKTGARLRWENIKQAKETDFFRWFSLTETGSAKDENGRKVVTFRPESEKFHGLVSLDVVLHEDGTIAVVHLSLARAFVEDEIDGIFARDIAKSFIRAAIPVADESSVTAVANEIEYRHNFAVITGIAASERPQLPPQPTEGFLAFVGRQQLYEGAFSQSRIRIEQADNDSGKAVVISIAAGR